MDNKLEIRREVRRRIKELDAAARASAASKIFSTIELGEPFRRARCIAFFASMGDEVPTSEALLRWRDMGKHIVVPRVEGDIMRFYDYDPATMQTGAFGIEEPMGDTEIDPAAIDLIIVPARAFTTKGDRLGRGGGYYDKYMSREGFAAYKIGIAFSCQIFDSLPTLPHDIVVDEVITEG
jgi:5-formyltetrahydrofolate cyclo-ligase